jgi:hypothetical protein
MQPGFTFSPIVEVEMSERNALSTRIRIARISLVAAMATLVVLAAMSMHATETTNRIAANRIAANRISANRLEANPDTADMLQTEDGREVYSYMMSCALREGAFIEASIPNAPDTAPPDTLYTCTKGQCSFPGSLGLAEHWIDRKLDTKGQRWVTACLLARVNHFRVTESISLGGVAPQLSVTPEEAATYTLQEGAFYGNIFADADAPLDWNACRGKDKAAGDTGVLAMRACAAPDPNDPGRTVCGFSMRVTAARTQRHSPSRALAGISIPRTARSVIVLPWSRSITRHRCDSSAKSSRPM